MNVAVVRRLVLGTHHQQITVYECRHCGTNADADTETCSNCERESIVEYRIP